MVRKQKNIAWITDILKLVAKPGYLVIYAFVGLFSVAEAHLILPMQRRLIVCEVDPSCVTESMVVQILIVA